MCNDEGISKEKENLIVLLEKDTSNITYYLETDKNIYSIETEIEKSEDIFIRPVISVLEKRELKKFNLFQETKDTFTLLENSEKIEKLKVLKEKIEKAKKPEDNIFKKQEKLKYFFLKKEEIIFIYRYTSKAYIKSETFLTIKQKRLILNKEEDDRITLDKNIPDIIYFLDLEKAFLLNEKQAEYIIELDSHIEKIKEVFPEVQKKSKIFSTKSFPTFRIALEEQNKSKIRKFVNMIEEKTYEKFIKHREKAVKIKDMYSLNINFNKNNEIEFDKSTSMDDILHLLSDDYVQSFLDLEAKVME